MSKRNRTKRVHCQSSAFPFRLLQNWIKPSNSGETCKCGEEAHYSTHCFLDVHKMLELTASGKTEREVTDIVWNKALSKQLKGIYTIEYIAQNCQQCVTTILTHAVGEEAATLAMLPMLLGGLSSVVIGSELSSIEDDGKNFAGVAHAQTVDELLKQMRGQVVPFHLAKK